MAEDKLTDLEKDALKEIGNIGSGNASTRLSEYVKEKVELELTEIKIIDTTELVKEYSIEEKLPVVSVFERITGDAIGSIITLFDTEFAKRILDILEGQEIGETKVITEECQEKFKIIGQSLADSYVSALVNFLNQNLEQSNPIVQVNDKDIIMKFLLKGISPYITETVLILETKFNVVKYSLKGEFMILFGLKSLEFFKQAIRKVMGG